MHFPTHRFPLLLGGLGHEVCLENTSQAHPSVPGMGSFILHGREKRSQALETCGRCAMAKEQPPDFSHCGKKEFGISDKMLTFASIHMIRSEMTMIDEYKTIDEHVGEGYYTEKRSKFLAFAHHVRDAEEVRQLLDGYRKKYYDARHVCYAYMLGAGRAEFRANDDGEPSSTAGKPILGQINSRGLTDVLVVVVRYYGGVNLGTGGLISAYREAAASALDDARVILRQVEEVVSYSFVYPLMNDVMRIVKEMDARIVSQTYDNTCEIRLAIRLSDAEKLRLRLEKLSFE